VRWKNTTRRGCGRIPAAPIPNGTRTPPPARCGVWTRNWGITGLYPTHRDQIEYRADVGNDLIEHELVEVYVADAPNNLRITPNPTEVMATRWVDFYDLSADVTRHPEHYTPWPANLSA